MLYSLLRRAAQVALRWYYADVVVQGRERMPAHGPVLLVANHPNALVDAMVIAATVRRRVLVTAKATLFQGPLLAAFLRSAGVVPLRRTQDERAAARRMAAPAARNSDTFRLVTAALARGGVVLVFPEGTSHDAPALAPLKSGAARMALGASSAGVRGLHVVPVGLIFEAKERPRSRVVVRLGQPIDVDAWLATAKANNSSALTAEITAGLRRVTLNFASEARARRAIDLARALAAITGGLPTLAQPREFAREADLALRIEAASDALLDAPESVVRQADAFIARVEMFETRLAERNVTLAELHISPRARHGLRFAVREGAVITLALPAAAVGRVAHWLPLHLARAVAMRTLVRDPSRDQPAMRTMLLGAGALVLWYVALAAAFTHWFGGGSALLWLVGIFLAARVDVLLRDRLRRARQRARTYFALRADPALRAGALQESKRVLAEAVALERALTMR